MQKPFFILLFIFCIHASCFSQKITQQTFSIHEIEEIRINTDKIFQLNIFSTTDTTLKIETKMEGEYFKDVNITSFTKNKQFQLSCELAEGFEIPNDKLSAHKVFSVSMNIYIPTQLKVQLEGDATQIYVTGTYKKFLAILISGNYTLENFHSEAKIQTKKGNIHYISQKIPTFEKKSDREIIFFEKRNKVELKADNGKITYSSDKG